MDPKVGTDGVLQTYLEVKMITVVKEKAGSEGGGMLWRKNAEACNCQWGQKERETAKLGILTYYGDRETL